jgi:hypothetical protein
MLTSLLLQELSLLANCLEPADQLLLDLIFDRVDDAMLLEIAQADYGDDVAIHLEALHQIKAYNRPMPLGWHPGEVLCLTRWTEWDSLKAADGAIAQRNHWMRLFACTVLIWVSLEPENHDYQEEYWNHLEGEDSTVIQFLESALYLGEDVSFAALKFLSWRMQCQIARALIDEDFGNCPCYAIAMLLLWVSLDQPDSEIIGFLIAIAYCAQGDFPIAREIEACQLSQKWRDTIQRILLDQTIPPDDRLGKSRAARSNPALQKLAIELMGN